MGKKLLNIIKKSDLMNIEITHKGESIKFNLFEELLINENKINQEIRDQPSYQGFMGVLLSHLDKRLADEKQTLKNIYGKLFNKYKETIDNTTNRPYSNDRVDNSIQKNKDYSKQLKRVTKANFEKGIIETCVNSFNSRKDLIQSLSANVRKVG